MQQDLIVDLVGEIADEDVEVVGSVFLGIVVGLIRPVDADLLLMNAPAVEGLHSTLGALWVVVLHEAVVIPFGLELLRVGD